MNLSMSRYGSLARLSGGGRLSQAGRHSWGARAQELAYRSTRPLVQPVQPPAPRIIQNTVHQTVIHLHQTTHQHIQNRPSAVRDGQGNTLLLLRQTAVQPAPDSGMDESRPALSARRMLRILSAESARQTLRPFYQKLFQALFAQEREAYRGRPAQALLLVQRVLGRRHTLAVLRRFYLRIIERLDGALLHPLRDRGQIRRFRRGGTWELVGRYAGCERAVPEDLRHLPAAKRLPPLPPPPEPEAARVPREDSRQPPPPAVVPPLSGSDFRALVRGVADALGRQSRLESLRRGGV